MSLEPFIKKIDFKSGTELLKFGVTPESDWKKLLVITIALSVLVSALNIFMYIRVDRGEIFEIYGETGEEVPKLDIEELKKTTDYYESKASEFEKIKSGSSGSADPSV
jgi:hypothetical protein